jgi:hypothetical protein
MTSEKRGKWQREALKAALASSDGYLTRGACRVWSRAPTAVYACVQKGWLEMAPDGKRARLTPAGRELAEQLRAEAPAS